MMSIRGGKALTANPKPMTCPLCHELTRYITGEAIELTEEAVEEHLAQCSECQTRIDACDETSDLLIQSLAIAPPAAEDEPSFQELYAHLLSHPEATLADGEDQTVPSALGCPQRIGSYELLEPIGRGASARVYKARHVNLDRLVTLKLITAGSAASPSRRERFLREMKAIGKLDDPHIIRATDAGEEDGRYFLAMEYVPGIDVSEVVQQRGPLSIANACEIARQTCLGLVAAHAHGLVHRDIKPSNLLLSAEGRVLLLDLGLVRYRPMSTENTSQQEAASQPRPTTDEVGPFGTADYMSPEQWEHYSESDTPTDLYAVGCTLFKLLTGSAPFQFNSFTPAAKREAHLNQPAPKLRTVRAEVPKRLEKLVASLLAKSPHRRPRSAQEVADKLRPFIKQPSLDQLATDLGVIPLTSPGKSATATGRSTQHQSTRRAWLVSAATLMGGFYGAQRWWQSPPALDRQRWRSLLNQSEPLLLYEGASPNVQLRPSNRTLQIRERATSLVALGRPVATPYALKTDLQVSTSGNQIGFFYHGLLESQQSFACDAVMLQFPDDSGPLTILWSRLRFSLTPDSNDAKNSMIPSQLERMTPLGESSAMSSLETDHSFQNLSFQLILGKSAIPEAIINEHRIGETDWTLTHEARQERLLSPSQHPDRFLGMVGIICINSSASLQNVQLRYFNPDGLP